MVTIPLGRGAYRRNYTGAPEIQLLNRWLEPNPANPVEEISLIARPGTVEQLELDPGDWSSTSVGPMRGVYSLNGLFNNDLFVVCGERLYRIDSDYNETEIEGIVANDGWPEVAWQKGADYERLWIADGSTLQYYEYPSRARGRIYQVGSPTPGVDEFEVGGIYYRLGSVFSPSDDGSAAFPYVVDTVGSLYDDEVLITMAINATGVPGVDYSSTLTTPNPYVYATNSAEFTDVIFNSWVEFTANEPGDDGNDITLSIVAGTFWEASGPFLEDGGEHLLTSVPMPDVEQVPLSLTQASSYVFVSVGNSQRFYWINPGEVLIDPLNFATKESSPDNITALRTFGDNIGVIGEKSMETWYATGNLDTPIAPIDGRVYARGMIRGTGVVVNEGIFLVGDDGRVYSVGFQSGDATDLGWGTVRISNNGIEERIRKQIERENA